MRRFFVLLAMVALVPGSVQADHGKDYATGHVSNFPIIFISTGLPVGLGDVDFSARSNFNGTEPSGHVRITFRDMDPDFVLTGEVTCLLVVGNIATLGGVITGVRGGVAVGNAFSIRAVDSGKFSTFPDSMGVLLQTIPLVGFTPGLPCNATTSPSPVTDGEIVVHDSLTG